jgi:kinesin family protein 15
VKFKYLNIAVKMQDVS